MPKELVQELKELFKQSSRETNEDIRYKVDSLIFEERAELLFEKIFHYETVIYDKGNIFEATIYIDDQNNEFTKYRPLAYIVTELSDGVRSRVEVIDILESVRNDATSLGHPAITTAIRHWQKLLISAKYVERVGEYERLEDMQFWGADKFLKSARSNLEAIGKAILEGSRRNALSKEFVLNRRIEEIIFENTFVYQAWERTKKEHIVDIEELSERIGRVKSYLETLPDDLCLKPISDYDEKFSEDDRIDSRFSIELVVDFLKESGRIYLYKEFKENEKIRSQHPRWIVFKNSFISWYHRLAKDTVAIYRNTARNQNLDTEPYIPDTSGTLPMFNLFNSIGETLTISLTKACNTIICPSEIINSAEFKELLADAFSQD